MKDKECPMKMNRFNNNEEWWCTREKCAWWLEYEEIKGVDGDHHDVEFVVKEARKGCGIIIK